MTRLIMLAQVPTIIDLIIKGPIRLNPLIISNKICGLLRRKILGVVERFNICDLVRELETCVVPNVVMLKTFREP